MKKEIFKVAIICNHRVNDTHLICTFFNFLYDLTIWTSITISDQDFGKFAIKAIRLSKYYTNSVTCHIMCGTNPWNFILIWKLIINTYFNESHVFFACWRMLLLFSVGTFFFSFHFIHRWFIPTSIGFR